MPNHFSPRQTSTWGRDGGEIFKEQSYYTANKIIITLIPKDKRMPETQTSITPKRELAKYSCEMEYKNMAICASIWLSRP